MEGRKNARPTPLLHALPPELFFLEPLYLFLSIFAAPSRCYGFAFDYQRSRLSHSRNIIRPHSLASTIHTIHTLLNNPLNYLFHLQSSIESPRPAHPRTHACNTAPLSLSITCFFSFIVHLFWSFIVCYVCMLIILQNFFFSLGVSKPLACLFCKNGVHSPI